MRGKDIRRLLVTAVLLGLAVPSAAGVDQWTLSLPVAYPRWFQSSVAIDPTNPAIAYAATSAGVFKTTDRGDRWILVDPFTNASAVAINPRNPDNVVTGNGDFRGLRPTDTRFRRSDDGGLTWQDVPPLNDYEQVVEALIFDPSEPATVYAALHASSFGKSTDGGETWTIRSNGLTCCAWDFSALMDIATAGGASPAIYAAVSGVAPSAGLFSSTDGAESWNPVMLPRSGNHSLDVWSVSVDPIDPARLYVTGYYLYDPAVLSSGDSGKSWQPLSLPSSRIRRITVDPRLPTTLYAPTRDGVLRSTDRGATWTDFSDGLGGLSVSSVAIDSTGSLLYATTDAGVFVYELPLLPPSFEPLPEEPERLQRLIRQVVSDAGTANRSPSPPNAFILPAAGTVRGADGQMFVTEVSLANGRTVDQEVVLAWLPAGNVRGSDVPMFRATLPAASGDGSAMLTIFDVAELGLEGLGSIVIIGTDGGNFDRAAEIDGFARVWSPARCGSGTKSQSLQAITAEVFGGARRASALGLRHDGSYRTNVGIVNLDDVDREFTVLVAGERASERVTLSVPPFSLIQTALPDRGYGSLTFTVIADRRPAPWTAYGSSVDNNSGDGWAAVARPLPER
jgi:hypothetical protein